MQKHKATGQEATVDRLIIWDFDGTLAYRCGMWSGTLVEILQERMPDLKVSRQDVRGYLQSGFPWDRPEVSHEGIRDAGSWWNVLNPLFEKALIGVGVDERLASELALLVRPQFYKPDRWRLYDDTSATLTRLAERGWSHVVLSNHVPELQSILESLGIASLFQSIFTSALIGFEKPHPASFKTVLDAFSGVSDVWMIGDNPLADVQGAEQNGIPAILVRKKDQDVARQCDDLSGVEAILHMGRETN